MQNAVGRAVDTTIPFKIQMQIFYSYRMRKIGFLFLFGYIGKITPVRLHMYLKDIDHIIGCWIRIKEIPKIQQLKLKFNDKNIEKKVVK